MGLRTAPLAAWALASALAAGPALAQPPEPLQVVDTTINLAQVIAAQQAWCTGLLGVSAAYAKGGLAPAKAAAERLIDQTYGYAYEPVAFKPTLTSGAQTFRTSREGALAYFVGHNPAFPNDKGFAIQPWRSCRAVNQVVRLNGASAFTMGHVLFSDPQGRITSVDKTWVFSRESDGSIRIVLHHSSLPYGG